MRADDRAGAGSQDHAAAAERGAGVPILSRPARSAAEAVAKLGEPRILDAGPARSSQWKASTQSLSDVGGAGETPPHATGFPPTSRQSPRLDNPRCKDRDRQRVAIESSGKLAGVVALVIIGKTAASTTDLSTSEVDLAFTSRALGRVDRRAWRGRGVSTFMIRSFWPKGEPRRHRAGATRQRSSTRMIVRTRVVRQGSAGSSEPAVRS